jgi:hypothetical protein
MDEPERAIPIDDDEPQMDEPERAISIDDDDDDDDEPQMDKPERAITIDDDDDALQMDEPIAAEEPPYENQGEEEEEEELSLNVIFWIDEDLVANVSGGRTILISKEGEEAIMQIVRGEYQKIMINNQQ